MSITPAQQRRIIAQESAWADDGGFAPLDLSGFPSLQPLPPAQSRDDGRFSRDWRDTPLNSSATALREFVRNPDNEALERVGAETGHEDFVDEIRERRGELIAQQFKAMNPEYIPCPDSYEAIVKTLAHNALPLNRQDDEPQAQVDALIDSGHWTVANLTACYKALHREGLMPVPRGTARNLSAGQRLKVARLAQAGRIEQAIELYLQYSLPDEEVSLELINEPEYREVTDAAVWCVFEEVQLDYTPTPEREAFLRRHCGGRPITLPLLEAAWALCQKNEAGYSRSALLNQIQRPVEQPPVTAKELDELDDSAVDQLYRTSLRAYADQLRRAPGMIV